jgi:YaiO family outer membrane protein
MQKKTPQILFISFFILFLLQILLLAQEGKKEEALQALRTKHFSTAIKICLNELEKNPDDYDFKFILAQAYAFSNQWEKADKTITGLLKDYPENIDVLLLNARFQAWRKNYSEAKNDFKHILSLVPKNKEALMGLADTARWQGNLKEAEDIYLKLLEEAPENAEVYYKLGLLYKNMGNYAKAKMYLKKAVTISPDVLEYKNALKKIHPKFEEKLEIRYHHQIQTFNDDRKDYIDNQFNLYFNIPSIQTSLLLWLDQTKRFDTQDHQYKIELYPILWQKSYGHFYLTFSPRSIHYPQSSYLAEIYQNFLNSAEISLGYRKMNFKENPVSIYTGSLGYYWNQFYTWLKLYYIPEKKGNSISWTANIRRYFSLDNYIFLGFGIGSRPFKIMTIEDLWTTQAQIFLAGFNFFVFKNLRIQFFYSHRNEREGLKRNSFLMITGFRF